MKRVDGEEEIETGDPAVRLCLCWVHGTEGTQQESSQVNGGGVPRPCTRRGCGEMRVSWPGQNGISLPAC